MTRPCKVGVQLPEVERFVPMPEYLDLARRAEAVGFDSVWVGRLIVALGAGWNRREYDAFGFAYDRRVSRFEEALAIIVPLLREGRTTFHGQFYDVEDCVLDPRPVRAGGPPIMLGSN